MTVSTGLKEDVDFDRVPFEDISNQLTYIHLHVKLARYCVLF